MFILRVQILFIGLLVIGELRCQAYRTTRSIPWEAQSAEKPEDYDLPHERNEKVPNRHWDCQPDSQYIQEQISLTTKMLQDGDQFLEKHNNLAADDTVLVLGKAGSGKTSLVQFLIENDRLMSKKIDRNTGEYIFEDGERIGTSATESFTLYPELVNYNSTINFCDSPGFHDSRTSAHEIVSMNVMKSITKQFKKAKILLVENHASLQYGVAKNSFINTLRHVNDFVVDIDKYKDHIAIIATKIPLTFRITDDINIVSGIVTDEMFVESIVNYFNSIEESITEKLKLKISKNDREFYKKVIRLLQSLQSRDENGKATRVNVFRRPYMSGTPKTMPLLVKNKESLLETIMNLKSVEVEQNDFDYTLSNGAKMYLECILELTSDSYKNKINELSFKLTNYIHQKTQNYSSFHQVLTELESLHDALKHFSQNLDNTNSYNKFFEIVHDFISEHKIPLQYNSNSKRQVLEKYEEMLLKFVDVSRIFNPSSWTVPIRHVMNSMEDEVGWYRALNKLIDGLSSYEIQKNKSEIYKTIFHENSINKNNLMTLFINVTESTDFAQFMEAFGDHRKSEEMELVTKSLLKESSITCDINGRLIVKGFQVQLSEINSKELVHLYCNDTALKEVALLAVDTVFLDEDTIEMFKGTNLFVAAPKWKIIGKRRIVLSGQPGSKISGNTFADNGKDGRPGLPGGSGGSFQGIGLHFMGGENLHIELNGGRGGPGTDGAKGKEGEDGKDGVQKAIEALESSKSLKPQFIIFDGYESKEITRDILIGNAENPKDLLMYEDKSKCERFVFLNQRYDQCLTVIAGVHTYRYDGDCGSPGSPGGFGGEAGIGGLPGDQKLIELGESSGIHVESHHGIKGEYGSMGETGARGLNGIAITCFNIAAVSTSSPKNPSYWKCFNSDTSSVSCVEEPKLNGTVKYSSKGIRQPTSQNFTDFGYVLYYYSLLLNDQSSNPVFHKIISDFNESLRNNEYCHSLGQLQGCK